ncbi:MAG: hypothetical protein ACFFD4_08475 [Candidatus Odinarchaeota archaeon]
MSKLILENKIVEQLDSGFSGETINFLAFQSSLTLFKQSKMGPVAIGDVHLPFGTGDSEADLHKLGSFYSVAVGQGSFYNTGCFGPLPALGSEFNCLIYSVKVKDTNTFDPRMDGWNYIFACFFYRESLNSLLNQKRKQIEGIFDEFFSENNDLLDLGNIKIQLLKQRILEHIIG